MHLTVHRDPYTTAWNCHVCYVRDRADFRRTFYKNNSSLSCPSDKRDIDAGFFSQPRTFFAEFVDGVTASICYRLNSIHRGRTWRSGCLIYNQ